MVVMPLVCVCDILVYSLSLLMYRTRTVTELFIMPALAMSLMFLSC